MGPGLGSDQHSPHHTVLAAASVIEGPQVVRSFVRSFVRSCALFLYMYIFIPYSYSFSNLKNNSRLLPLLSLNNKHRKFLHTATRAQFRKRFVSNFSFSAACRSRWRHFESRVGIFQIALRRRGSVVERSFSSENRKHGTLTFASFKISKHSLTFKNVTIDHRYFTSFSISRKVFQCSNTFPSDITFINRNVFSPK